MPTSAEQVPAGLGGLALRVRALERALAELRAARRLESAAVGAGGLGVIRGGRFYMATPAGGRMVDIGAINADSFNNADGTPQQAILLRRQDGSVAITAFASSGSGSSQFVGIWDASGNIVLSDDAASGEGLARPYLPVSMWPAYDGGWPTWPSTASATMAELWGGQIYRQQPRLVVVARASMDTSGATGQVQLTINGVAQGAPQSVGFGVSYFTFGPVDLTGYGYMQQLAVAVTGLKSAGTGTLRASVYSAYTLQS